MDLTDLIEPGDIFLSLKADCKKQVLKDISELAAKKTEGDGQQIFQTLLEREKLGSTGVGNGIAIPHGKIDGLKNITGILAILEKPIDFEALDDQPVDVIFLLLTPEVSGAEHLKALAKIARILREKEILTKLREANDRAFIYELISKNKTSHAA